MTEMGIAMDATQGSSFKALLNYMNKRVPTIGLSGIVIFYFF
jgi:hypothetical protein